MFGASGALVTFSTGLRGILLGKQMPSDFPAPPPPPPPLAQFLGKGTGRIRLFVIGLAIAVVGATTGFISYAPHHRNPADTLPRRPNRALRRQRTSPRSAATAQAVRCAEHRLQATGLADRRSSAAGRPARDQDQWIDVMVADARGHGHRSPPLRRPPTAVKSSKATSAPSRSATSLRCAGAGPACRRRASPIGSDSHHRRGTEHLGARAVGERQDRHARYRRWAARIHHHLELDCVSRRPRR